MGHRSLLLAIALTGCSRQASVGDAASGPDLSLLFPDVDASTSIIPQEFGFDPAHGTPFPLPSDQPPDPRAGGDHILCDPDGALVLDIQSIPRPTSLWLALTADWGGGTLSRIDSKTLRETGRYPSVTCHSLKTGSKMNCDGQNGCCASDSNPQWEYRKNNMPQGPYQQVQLKANWPSRTAVDLDGDVWVANRAFGGQPSVTKIASDPARCIDRNKNGRIDTSRDVNKDGLIQTDCNLDALPDDEKSVTTKPCANGLAQEYFGLDDECVLFTTNIGGPSQIARPLALGPGPDPFDPSDAWAGTYSAGQVFRIDGKTGLTKDMAQLPQGCKPYGLAIDDADLGWLPPAGYGSLCFFNTRKAFEVGITRSPPKGPAGYGIALDRDRNLWLGGSTSTSVFRYTPNRKNGFMDLGNGYWTIITSPGGNAIGNLASTYRGIAVDRRSVKDYFAFVAVNDGWVARIPASAIPVPQNMDSTVDGAAYSAVRVAGTDTSGVGVDFDQNLWAASTKGSVVTRVTVDGAGTMAPPDLLSAPMGSDRCPAGDRCELKDSVDSDPQPYTYSDFTGFGLRNTGVYHGSYVYVVEGCTPDLETHWLGLTWQADQPPNTRVAAQVRGGNAPAPDFAFGYPTPDLVSPPVTLSPVYDPILSYTNFLQVRFLFESTDAMSAPRLKNFSVTFGCTVP